MPTAVSIMLPTRFRTRLSQRSLESLVSLARHPDQIELAVVADDDDHESRDFFLGTRWAQKTQDWGCTHQFHMVPRMGYSRLNEYLNYLAPRTQGRWLLFWNDDAVMETPHWDQWVHDNIDWLGLLHMTCRNVPQQCSIFPLFNRQWLDVFGMVSPNTFSDSWISDVARGAGARRVIPVTTWHDRFEETGNNRDQTWAERSYANRRDYHSDANKQLRRQWSDRLREYRARVA